MIQNFFHHSSQSSGDDEESSYLSDESEFEETTSTSLQSIESYPIRSSDVYSADIIIHLKSTEVTFFKKNTASRFWMKFLIYFTEEVHAKMELYDPTTRPYIQHEINLGKDKYFHD